MFRADSPPPDAWNLAGSVTPPSSPPRGPASKFAVVDAFTSNGPTPFTGNPADVVLLPSFGSFPSDAVLQAVAAEFNHSETAFTFRRGDGPGYALRWWTPTQEVDLCGHATLAAAHALVTIQSVPLPLSFHTRSGELKVSRDAAGVLLEMDFPAAPPTEAVPAAWAFLKSSLAAALGGVTPLWVGRSDVTTDMLAVLDSEDAVRNVVPDAVALASMGGRGVVVTAQATAGAAYDFVSRCFYPGTGIAEDPVTGSAHCMLGPFWAPRLGKQTLVGRQLSARGGSVLVTVQPGGARCTLSGSAVTIMQGEMAVPL